MEDHSSLEEEISAELQISVPKLASTVKKHYEQSREYLAKLDLENLVEKIDKAEIDSPLQVAGISTRSKTMEFRGGRLVAICGAIQKAKLSKTGIEVEDDDYRFKVGILGHSSWRKRIIWCRIGVALDLMASAIQGESEVIFTDIPLTAKKGLEASLHTKEIELEWSNLMNEFESFWRMAKEKVYPFNENGIVLSSIQQGWAGEDLLQNLDNEVRGESISFYLKREIHELLLRKLKAGTRTKPLAVKSDLSLKFDGTLPSISRELSSFYVRGQGASSIVRVELPGSNDMWVNNMIEQIHRVLLSATVEGVSTSIPLPLWIAKKKSNFDRNILEYIANRISYES